MLSGIADARLQRYGHEATAVNPMRWARPNARLRKLKNAVWSPRRRLRSHFRTWGLGQARFLVQRPNAAGADVQLAWKPILKNRRALNIEPEHPVGPALRVAHVVPEAWPTATNVTFTGHRVPLYQRVITN